MTWEESGRKEESDWATMRLSNCEPPPCPDRLGRRLDFPFLPTRGPLNMKCQRSFVHFAGIVLGMLSSCSLVFADVKVPNVFSDHMVLQRGQKNKVWGRADAGEAVTVSIGTQVHKATADSNGAWHVMLDTLEVGVLMSSRYKAKMKSASRMYWLAKFGFVLGSPTCNGGSRLRMTQTLKNSLRTFRTFA